MLVKLDFDVTIILPPRQPKSFKAIKWWNIQKENEFRKDSAWVIQWAVWRQNQIVEHQIWTDDQANKKKETQEGFPTQFSIIPKQRKGCLHNFDSDSKYSVRTVSYNERSGRSFRRHTRQSFTSKLAVGAPHSAFSFLSFLFLGSVILKTLRPFTYKTPSTYSYFLTDSFQEFDRSTWFNSRLNWRRTTRIISSWSTSTTHRISIIFRTLHKNKVIRFLLGSS